VAGIAFDSTEEGGKKWEKMGKNGVRFLEKRHRHVAFFKESDPIASPTG
jgi:hypothetical protein